MKHLTTFLLLGMLLCVCAGCRNKAPEKQLHGLPGAWTLVRQISPIGTQTDFPHDGMTYCRIFCSDSTFYECQLRSTLTGTVIIPTDKGGFEFINKGKHDFIYMENGRRYPLKMVNDTTMVMQRYGRQYTYIRNHEMSPARIREIRNTINENYDANVNTEVMRFVLSTTERELKATNSRLVYILSGLAAGMLLILTYAYRLRRRKQQTERQLAQIKEEQATRPQLMAEAARQTEEKFFRSDYFDELHRRILSGKALRAEEWDEVERNVRPVYQDFFRRLSGLCKMSDTERRVCLLIKLRFSPTETANILCKDISTVSSIRARLYKKVFHRSGGAKEWDSFIHSL